MWHCVHRGGAAIAHTTCLSVMVAALFMRCCDNAMHKAAGRTATSPLAERQGIAAVQVALAKDAAMSLAMARHFEIVLPLPPPCLFLHAVTVDQFGLAKGSCN